MSSKSKTQKLMLARYVRPVIIKMENPKINSVLQKLPKDGRSTLHDTSRQNVNNEKLQAEMPRENPNNVFISEQFVNELLASYGVSYKIKSIERFQRAFVHTSYLIEEVNGGSAATASDTVSTSAVDKSMNSTNTRNTASSTTNTSTASTNFYLDASASDKMADFRAAENAGIVEKDKRGVVDKSKSTVNNLVPLQPESYERLEYIGDAILNAATAHYVFLRFPSEGEGFMTTLRTKLVRSKTLARISRKLKLHKYILLSLYTDQVINGRSNRNTLEDVFESFIGALYLDCGSDPGLGFGICLKFITNVFEKWVDIVNMINRDDNYKKNLLEYYQKRFRTEAKYQIISVRGKKPRKIFTMAALSPTGEIIGIGQAKKKVDADQMASKQALIHYGQEVESSEEDSMS
jgi:ribonuclease III